MEAPLGGCWRSIGCHFGKQLPLQGSGMLCCVAAAGLPPTRGALQAARSSCGLHRQ